MKKLLLLSILLSLGLVVLGYGQKKFNDVSPETIRQSRSSISSLQEGAASALVANEGGSKMTFQGSLFKNGEVFNGTSSISFSMAIDSSSNWEEIHDAVSVINGLYSVVLGQFNPLPYDLFHNVNERLLEVNVDGTVLGTVKLYAPFSAEANNLIIKKVSPSSDTTLYEESALVSWIEGEASPGVVNRGVEALAMTSGLNRGVEAWAIAEVGNDEFQTGIQGYARSEGAGFTTGTWGIAEGEGSGPRYGMRGEVHGAGSSFSVAARGLNFVVPQDSGYAAGARFDVRGVGAPGAWQAGVEGLAFKDQGRNVGVYGRAFNGDENWAGWFEGDVKVTGRIISDGGIIGQLPLDFAGENGNRSVMLSSEGATGNDGVLRLSDENGFSRVTMFANRYYNVLDTVNSTDSTDVYEPVYTGAGGAWIGGANGSQSVFISSDGPENSNGYVNVSGSDGQTRGRLASRQFNNGFARGEVALNNNTDGRNSILRPDQLYFYNDQGGYPGWFGTYGTSGFSQLIGYDSSNTVTGALLTGFFGNQNPKVWLEDANANMTSNLTINDNAGELTLNGNEWNPNIRMGGKHWENSNLAYLSLMGEMQVQGDILADSTGALTDTTYYHPELVGMQAEKWDNSEAGFLFLNSTEADHGIRMYGGADFQSDGNIRSHLALDGPNGSYVYLWGHGEVNASGSMTAVSFDQTSDQRFKTKVELIDGSLSKLKQLNGYTYFWNEKAKNEKGINDENEQIGVLAQEVEKLFPQLVSTDENGYKSVNYGSLTAVLIEAIKELSTEVATLKVENESLKSEVKTAASLENRLEKLESLLGLKSDVSSSAQNNK